MVPSEVVMAGPIVTQMIYNEKTFAGWDVQQSLFAGQQEQLRSQRFGVIASAGQAYLGVLLAEAQQRAQIENLDLTRQNMRIAEVREQAGAGAYRDVLRWQSQMYQDERQVVTQGSTVLVNRFALNQVRDRPREDAPLLEELTVEDDGFIFSSEVVVAALDDEAKARVIRDFLVELGLANAPALLSLDREIAAQSRQLTSNRRWLIPQAEAFAVANAFLKRGGDGADEKNVGFWMAGATLNWTVFDGAASGAKVRQASSELQSLNFQRSELQSSLEQTIRASVAVAMASYRNIRLAQAQAETAALNFRLVRDSYLEGESALLDLLDAQEQKLSADSSLSVTLYTFLSDLLSAEQAMGYFPFLQSRRRKYKSPRSVALENRLQGQR